MTKFSDIDADRLIYTCNCGWLDLGHGNPKNIKADVGAANLWKQLQQELGTTSEYDAAGFKVMYSQEMKDTKYTGMTVGTTKVYFVRRNLDAAKKKSIALAIFKEVSLSFETQQGAFPFGVFSGDSSFSQEDLVSNLFGFYKAIYPNVDFFKLCGPVSKEASKEVWNTDGSVGSTKNRTFKPNFHGCKECLDKPRFPKELEEITAAAKDEAHPPTKGVDFRDWDAMTDEKTAVEQLQRETRIIGNKI